MSWIRNAIFLCFLIAAFPWLLWRAIRLGKNRRGWSQKLWGLVPTRTSDGNCIWFHAVSVGEVNLLAPILKQLQQIRPDFEFVISTTTETGYDLARKKYPDQLVFFCPMDFTWAIKRAIRRIRPQMLVLAELEIWPNLISTMRNANIPVAVVNARLSESSFRGYQQLRWLIGPTIRQISLVAAQNETYAQRFINLGCDASIVTVTGSVKFDGVETNRHNPRTEKLAKLANLTPDENVLVAGSTQVEEDLITAEVYQQLSQQLPTLRLILVPRHPERCDRLVQLLHQRGLTTIRRSELGKLPIPTNSLADESTALKPILVVDVIGELRGWWGRADIAYVGGSMGRRGGQNMIEPAAFGIPVSFGPNTKNFKEIVHEFLSAESAVVVHNAAELSELVRRAIENPSWAVEIGERAQNVVLSHLGASQRTAKSLCNVLSVASYDKSAPIRSDHVSDAA